jgi:uncharacterized membrane protein
MTQLTPRSRVTALVTAAAMAGLGVVGAAVPADAARASRAAWAETACRPAIRALPLPSGQTNGDVLSAVPDTAVGFVADDAQHQHVAIWRRAGARWSVQDLGDLGITDAFSGLSATGVNAHGAVSVGINTNFGMGGWEYVGGALHPLHDFAGGTAAYARAINDSGVVAGEALDSAGNDFAAVWPHWWSRPIKLRPSSGLDGSFAQGIDDRGRVVGGSFSNGPPPTVAMRWSRTGVPTTLTGFGADAQAWDINNSGRVVGDATTADGQRAAVWDSAGHGTTLDVFAGMQFSRLIGVNERGEAIGWDGVNPAPPAIPVRRVLLWTGRGPARSLLPITRNWSDGALAHAIDDRGTVYGSSTAVPDTAPVPTIWTCAAAQSFVPMHG